MDKKELLNSLKDIDGSDIEALNKWVKNFILSDIDDADKMDLLVYGKTLFSKLRKSAANDIDKTFFKLISRSKFLEALRFSKYMSYQYPEKRDEVKELVKHRDIFLLSPKLEITMGGLGHIVRHRANYLAEKGYNVTLLNAGPLKNYRYILNHYKSTNQLSGNVNFHNYIEYYSIKNSNGTKKQILNDVISSNKNGIIHKILNDDDSITLEYFRNNEQVKSELYIDECLVYKKEGNWEYYFTQDGFKFYEANASEKIFNLYERESGLVIEFTYKNQFLNHFLTEVCFRGEKPFIICDSTRQWYHMNKISLDNAFKIGALHGNPFTDFDPEKGINPHVTHFKNIEGYDKVVLLTKSVYDEVVEAGIDEDYLTIIPNFVSDDALEYDEVEKDINKIAVFSRVAKTKQISHMIKAFDMIRDKHENAYLEIYGAATDPSDIEEMENLKEMLKELKLDDRIFFKGYIEDVASEMKKSLFSLLTSKEEGFSLSTIELMANSTPIISYDIRYGPSDLITNNADGILLEKDDIDGLARAMSQLLENPDDTIEMGRKAKDTIKKRFSRSSVCPMWEDLFIDIFIEDELDDQIAMFNAEDSYNRIVKKNLKINDEKKELKKENNKLKKEIEDLNKFKSDVLSSTSWNITKPLRKLRR